jgi:hypothetical protein
LCGNTYFFSLASCDKFIVASKSPIDGSCVTATWIIGVVSCVATPISSLELDIFVSYVAMVDL